ncbi:MAG: hypothetical protein KAS15_06735, partial [Nanoarchaeota archaeon]|nr:hypothetical protein [Nanoarchaeota archaeon]
GNTAIVGARNEDTGGDNAGAAYIFRWNGATWTQQAKIQASDKGAGDYFGGSVSISSDGNTAIAGARFEDTGGSNAGAVYIFIWNGATWTQQAKIMAGDKAEGDQFGYSVSISSDSNTALIGAEGEDTGGSAAGAAYIFRRSGATWTEQDKIQAGDAGATDYFGHSVSISSDGNTAIVGAFSEDTAGDYTGAAYIYRWTGAAWTQQAKIQAGDKAEYDQFGYSVSISSDGNTAIIGAKGEDTGGSATGAAYIFRCSGTIWTQQAKIQASDKEIDDSFGNSVSISSDGNTAIVGANSEDTGGSSAGAAYIFRWTGTAWAEQAKIQASNKGADDFFGNSVSVSYDGDNAIVGAHGEDEIGNAAGTAYIFNYVLLANGNSCSSNADCISNYCRTDLDGVGKLCADSSQCVYSDTVRDNGYSVCYNNDDYTCNSGTWGSEDCGTNTACGYYDDITSVCSAGSCVPCPTSCASDSECDIGMFCVEDSC